MAACYDFGDRISPWLGIRYSVQTGSSIGQKSSRIYYRQVLLCQTCVLVRRRSDKQALFVMRIAGGIILAFLVMLWTIGHNAPSKHQVKSTDLTRRNSPSISPTPSTVPEIATSPQAVSSEGIFNAELFEPPSNCRTAPKKSSGVQQVLRQKGDILVDRENSQADSKGEIWYKEKYLGCWLHYSQIRLK